MHFDILTIFPEMFVSPLEHSILKRALAAGQITAKVWDIRDYAEGVHQKVDDTPYGGGAGMVFKPEPLVKALAKLEELKEYDQLALVCGRYEGVDQRAVELVIDEEICVGDYVVTGGELPALLVMDGVTRLLPGVLGNENSLEKESFAQGLLEHPHYTKPPVFRGLEVPCVLRSGHHRDIEDWQRRQSLKITLDRRPDLLEKADLTPEDQRYLKELQKEKKSVG